MKKIAFVILSIICAFTSSADVNTDKAMAKISRDTKTYISADARAAREDAAYNEAMQKLSAQISDYFKIEFPAESMPDAIYLSNISSIYERMTSKIADNRYRVMLYVKKSDLKPIGGNGNALVLSKNESDVYSPVPTEAQKAETEEIVKTDTIVTVVKTPMNPTLSQIANLKTREELTQTLQNLRKSKNISGAAAFPMANANNYYIAVLRGDRLVEILHFSNGQYKEIISETPVDMLKYTDCTGYWFTL